MKIKHAIIGFLFFPIVIGAILLGGCGKQQSASTPSNSAVVSAEKNSFQEVTSKLDAGGNFYVYLSTESWLKNLSGGINGWRDFANSFPNTAPADQQNLNRAFDVLTSLVKNSGVEEVSGVGMSSILREPGMYRTTLVLHHYKGKGNGFLWSMFGNKPHGLAGLDLMPASTAFASFGDFDAKLGWSTLQKEIAESGIPGAKEGLQQVPDEFEKDTGLKFDDVLASLGGEYGFVLTLDEKKMINVPAPGGSMQIPEPGFLLIIKVKNDVIFDRVDAVLAQNKQVQRTDRSGLKMRTMPLGLPLPIALRPTIARSGDYLFIATTDTLISDALDVQAGKKPGLKASAEFKRLAQGVPESGNQFSFVSQKFGDTLKSVQSQAAQNAGDDPRQAALAMLRKLLSRSSSAQGYTVSANGDEGWVSVGNGNTDPGRLVLLPAIAVGGLMAGIAVPNFLRARTTAQKNQCINNLRMIDAAKAQWALEGKKNANDVPTWADIKPFTRGSRGSTQPTCPQGGVYQLNKVGDPPTCSIPGHSLPQY